MRQDFETPSRCLKYYVSTRNNLKIIKQKTFKKKQCNNVVQDSETPVRWFTIQFFQNITYLIEYNIKITRQNRKNMNTNIEKKHDVSCSKEHRNNQITKHNNQHKNFVRNTNPMVHSTTC